MNTNKKFNLYKEFLRTDPVKVVRDGSQENNICCIKIEYNIDGKQLFVNASCNEKTYNASVSNYKGQRLTVFHNPFFAKTLYEYGQKYL